MKQTERITRSLDLDAMTVTFNVPGFDPLIIAATALPTDVQRYATLHGINQTCGDAAAIEYTQPDGTVRKPTMAEKYRAIADRAERLQTAWKSESGGGEDASLLVEALMMLSGADRETVEFEVAAMSAEERREIARDPTVGYRILEIRRNRQYARAQNTGATANTANLLSRLKKS